jgi:hypothetical protein
VISSSGRALGAQVHTAKASGALIGEAQASGGFGCTSA